MGFTFRILPVGAKLFFLVHRKYSVETGKMHFHLDADKIMNRPALIVRVELNYVVVVGSFLPHLGTDVVDDALEPISGGAHTNHHLPDTVKHE